MEKRNQMSTQPNHHTDIETGQLRSLMIQAEHIRSDVADVARESDESAVQSILLGVVQGLDGVVELLRSAYELDY